MADLGAIGVTTPRQTGTGQLTCPDFLRIVSFGEYPPLSYGVTQGVDGDPTAPSLVLSGRYARSKRLRLPVRAGAGTLTCKVRQDTPLNPRPSIAILENSELGIAFQEATAPSGPGWVTIGPMSFTSSADGGIEVELRAGYTGVLADTEFDSLRVIVTEPFNVWFKDVPIQGFRQYSFVGWLNGAPFPDSDFAFASRRRVAIISPML